MKREMVNVVASDVISVDTEAFKLEFGSNAVLAKNFVTYFMESTLSGMLCLDCIKEALAYVPLYSYPITEGNSKIGLHSFAFIGYSEHGGSIFKNYYFAYCVNNESFSRKYDYYKLVEISESCYNTFCRLMKNPLGPYQTNFIQLNNVKRNDMPDYGTVRTFVDNVIKICRRFDKCESTK